MPCAFYESPLGWIKIVANQQGIIKIDFTHPQDYEALTDQQSLPWIKGSQDDTPLGKCIIQLQEYFLNKRKIFDLSLKLSGTDFQKSVWLALKEIPHGKTISYQKIAKQAGYPLAHRAAANAIAANPLSIVLPCHRVVLSSGRIGGYAWGEDKKQWLLKHEKTINHEIA